MTLPPLTQCNPALLYRTTRTDRNPSRALRLLPDRPVHLLVKWRTARRKLAQFVVLGAHQCRAIAERAADALAVELAALLDLLHEVRLRQRRPADADEGAATVAHVGGGGVDQILLQIAIAAADDRPVREILLNLRGQRKMPGDTNERMLRCGVTVGGRIF